MRLVVLLISIFIGVQAAHSQWIVEVTISGYTNAPQCMWTTSQPSFSSSFLGHSASGSTGGALQYSFTHPTGEFNASISASGQQQCNCVMGNGMTDPECTPAFGSNSGSLPVIHHSTDSEQCVHGSQSYNGGQFYLSIGYTIYKKMDPPDVTPSGGCGGSVTLTALNAAPGYIWEVTDDTSQPSHWSTITGKSTQVISVTAIDLNRPNFHGTLRYVRVNASGCSGRLSAASNSFNILAPPPTSANLDWGAVSCYGRDDAVIKVNSVSGSATNYIYTLRMRDPATGIYNIIFQNDGVAPPGPVYEIDKAKVAADGVVSGIKKGDYRVEIANNVDPSELGACSISYDNPITQPDDITITPHPTHIKCNGESTGALSVTVTGGVPGYSYSWSNGAGNTTAISGVAAGKYTVNVTDSKGCPKALTDFELTQPTKLVAAIVVDKLPSCWESNDGQLSVSVTAGTGVSPYSYSWNSGHTTPVASSLARGSYTVTVKDNNNCLLPVSENLSAPPPIVVTLSMTPPVCPGVPDGGKVRVDNVDNEFGAPTYLWNTGDITQEVVNVPSGNYSVVVSSVHGTQTCQGSASINVIDPNAWTASIVPVLQYNGAAISCPDAEDGRLNVILKNDLGQTVSGEFYIWSNGESGTTQTFIDGLGEDSYNVSVRYNGVCQATNTYALLAPKPLVIDITPDVLHHGQVLTCHDDTDGVITATASFGTGLPSSFSYLWNTGSTNPSISNLGPGTYSIIVKDVNQCEGTSSFTIDNPEEVSASIPSFSDYSGFGITCNGKTDGFLTAAGTGGSGGYTFLWSNGQTSPTISNLAPDDYSVDVSDNNGCKATASRTITEPTVLTLQVDDREDVSCFNGSDGSITLLAQGGAPDYQYSKDNTNWQFPSVFDGLPIGSYNLYVRDANACKVNVAQVLTQPTQIQISFTGIEPAYCADPRGKATGVVTGGVGSYDYKWRNGGEPAVLSTTDLLSNVPAGIYELTVTDEHNCPMMNSVPITSTDGAGTTYTSVDARCIDSADGTAEIEITDGDGPFIIKWPDNNNTLARADLKKGTYNVLITDGHDCTVVQTVTVNAPEALQLNIQNESIPTCNSYCDGSITLSGIGGVGGYTYTWNGQPGAHQVDLCAGLYPVILKDANNCILSTTVKLDQPDPIEVVVAQETLATCTDGCDGALEVAASGGNGGYTYEWASGETTTAVTNICPGSYDITVTDMKGCTGTHAIELNNTPEPAFNLGGGVTLCVGQTYVLDAGPQWTSVNWGSSTGIASAGQTVSVSEDGFYWADVISNKGCVARDTFLVQTSRDLLHAEFFMASSASVGDTIVMVEVSWPLPDAVEWSFPAQMKKLLDSDGVVFGQYNTPGNYEVALTAHLAECVDIMRKMVTILDAVEDPDNGRLGYDSFVKEFILHPNPNDGRFDVTIEFEAESHMVISIWNAVDLKLVGKISDEGKSMYNEQVDLRPLPAGHYLMRLDHDKGKEYIRFVIY
jgi:hypothetical protein